MSAPTELRNKTAADLKVQLLSTQRELAEARRSHAARELVNPVQLKTLRREIARLHTLITEMQQAADKEKK